MDEDRFGCVRFEDEELLWSLVLGFERRLLTEMELIVSATNTRVAMDFSVWLVPGVGESYRWTSGGDGGYQWFIVVVAGVVSSARARRD